MTPTGVAARCRMAREIDDCDQRSGGTRLARSYRMNPHAVASAACDVARPPDLTSLIRAEYREIPGLSVTLAQAARLWNVDRGRCLEALEALTTEGFLCRSRDMYQRSTCVRRWA